MGSIVVPITIAASFGLDNAMTVALVQRTLFVLGLAGILQVFFGHRLPIQEGPAGLWWGVFLLYAGIGPILFRSHIATLQTLQFALLFSGLLFILLSCFNLINILAKLITPTVVSIYLILLVAQLSGPFFRGMTGISEQINVINIKLFTVSIILVLLSFGFMRLPKIGHFSVLFTIGFGWILFYLLDLAQPVIATSDLFKFPEIFAFGPPKIELNMTIMIIIITILLLTNMLASIKVMEQLFARKKLNYEKDRLQQSGIIAGINQLLGGIFSTIGAVPISASAGFIATTKIVAKLPFIIGSAIIVFVSFFPKLTSFVASIPPAVGYAAMFPAFASLLVLALQSLETVENKTQSFKIVGISLFIGIGVMFIPPEAFASLPPTLASIFSNGLVLGSLIAIIIESTSCKKTL